MSHFSHLRTSITDEAALLAALDDLGFDSSKVQIHDPPVALRGFLGDRRVQRATIVLPRKYVGSLSNDIGFERDDDGLFRVWISDFDKMKYGVAWLARLHRRYAYHAVVATMTTQGFTIATEEASKAGEVRLVLRRTV